MWPKDRHIDHCNRTESSEVYPYFYGQLIFNKDAERIKWRKNSLLNKWFPDSRYLYKRKNEVGPFSHSTHKKQYKMDYRHQCKSQNYKALTRNVRVNLYDLGLGKNTSNQKQK